MARSHEPQKGPTHQIHWSSTTLAVSSSSKRNLLQFVPVKSCLVMAKAKHLAGFIDAPVYPGTSPAVAKLTSPREHSTAKGPPKGLNSSRWRGSRATPKARALHASNFSRKYHLLHSMRTHSKAEDKIVSIKSACSAAIVPGFRKQPPPLNLERVLEL